jgi:hypothetical protein
MVRLLATLLDDGICGFLSSDDDDDDDDDESDPNTAHSFCCFSAIFGTKAEAPKAKVAKAAAAGTFVSLILLDFSVGM